ncbi:MAG: long-chain fatty acid--CoA ligase [Proteobacteria bacterium]|nr:long-chain fatty acid--CoA ligase [Pseudomonadota bacterium]MBI3495830.1 long-chain fatty acid--CoA ligase [Pseudomonadota bacterium]
MSPHYPPDISWDAPIPSVSLGELLDRSVERFGHLPAIDFLDRIITYAELGRLVARATKGFQALGVGPGVQVGLYLPNCPYSVICYYAVLKAGGTVVNFNPLYAPPETKKQIDDSQSRIMVTLDLEVLYPKLAQQRGQSALETIVVCSMADALPGLKRLLFPWVRRHDLARIAAGPGHVRFADLIANDGAYAPVAIDPATAVAVLQYTGGTTGTPKGAMLTHRNLSANVEQCRLWFTRVEYGRVRLLSVLPFFHVFAMTVLMNVGIALGGAIIMLPRFEIKTVLRTIHKKRPTFMAGVPTMYTAINTANADGRYDLASIENCLSGGAPLPLEVKQRFEALTGCKLVEGYGLTETSPVSNCNPLYGLNKEGSIGLPFPGTRVELRDLEDPHRVVPLGDRGEICIGGPQVMAGYWRQPEATAQVFIDGLLRTGDVGRMDEDGYVFIVDRIKDLILCGGYNVYPRNIEEAIYQHPAVEEATVIGVPDSYRGQSPKAFCKLKTGAVLDAETLKAFLKERLSSIEMPREIEFRDALPKTLIGKLSKKELIAEEAAKRQTTATAPSAPS